MTIEISVSISKAMIPVLGKLKGKGNANWIGDNPPGSLIFLGFAGAHVGDQIYEGVLRFEKAPEPLSDYDCVELNLEGFEQ